MAKDINKLREENTRAAIAAAGGQQRLAKTLGVRQQTVSRWVYYGVPASRLRRFCTVTGSSPAEIRPDLLGRFVAEYLQPRALKGVS